MASIKNLLAFALDKKNATFLNQVLYKHIVKKGGKKELLRLKNKDDEIALIDFLEGLRAKDLCTGNGREIVLHAVKYSQSDDIYWLDKVEILNKHFFFIVRLTVFLCSGICSSYRYCQRFQYVRICHSCKEKRWIVQVSFFVYLMRSI
jgi:hypothetical protein